MAEALVAVVRKIYRQISRQIFRQNRTLTLPVPAHPQGQESGAVPGAIASPPEPQRALLEELTEKILSALPDIDCRERGARVMAKLRDLVGDLPASANHHHSSRFGLLQHSLEVALKMLDEFEETLFTDVPPNATVIKIPADSRQLKYVCFLAGLGHDLGKLFDIDLRAENRVWSPLHETYAQFLRRVEMEPVLTWNEKRVRGGHAQFSPWLMHHLLSPADIRFIGLERLRQLTAALTGTHTVHASTPLAHVVSKLDQESVEQAAPEWMIKRPDSKVNHLIRALKHLIAYGELSVNTPGAPVYVTGDKAAVVIPLSISAARDFLKRNEGVKLPSNHRLYDLLAQAKIVEADENRQCVKRIRVPGKRGPVELYALVFATSTILPQAILPTLPNATFEVVPEQPNQPDARTPDKPNPLKVLPRLKPPNVSRQLDVRRPPTQAGSDCRTYMNHTNFRAMGRRELAPPHRAIQLRRKRDLVIGNSDFEGREKDKWFPIQDFSHGFPQTGWQQLRISTVHESAAQNVCTCRFPVISILP